MLPVSTAAAIATDMTPTIPRRSREIAISTSARARSRVCSISSGGAVETAAPRSRRGMTLTGQPLERLVIEIRLDDPHDRLGHVAIRQIRGPAEVRCQRDVLET